MVLFSNKPAAIKDIDYRSKTRTSININKSTKEKLNKTRAPGQCYDGFLCQLVDFWEISKNNNSLSLKNFLK